MQILKTAFPLLIMNMETIVDQISSRFKATPEEETYRIISILVQEALQVCFVSALAVVIFLYSLCSTQQYIVRMANLDDDNSMAQQIVTSLNRLANSFTGQVKVGISYFLFSIAY